MTDTQAQHLSASAIADNHTDTATNGQAPNADNTAGANTTQTYTITDDIRDITSAIVDTLRWFASFSLTDLICRIMGRGFDPEGCTLPEWPVDVPAETPFVILPNQHVQPEGEGWAVYDGVIYANAKTVGREPWQVETLTVAEMIALQGYNPSLRNIPLARKIKYLLKQGQTDAEIATAVRYTPAYVKHHRLAFEKAANPSPTG